MKNYRCALLLPVLFVSSCMVGPDYESPDATIGAAELDEPDFSNSGGIWKMAEPSDRLSRGQWWEIFGDERLNFYMEKCRSDNPDLKSLFYKVEQARENACMSASRLYPHAGGGAGYLRAGLSDRSVFSQLGVFDDWITGASLTWDADLFGRIRSMLHAQRANAQAMLDEYENMLLLLQASTASAYFTLRELCSSRDILKEAVEARSREREFIGKRVAMKTASDTDLQRAVEQEFSALAQLSELDEKIALVKNYLANLLGSSSLKMRIEADGLVGDPPQIPKAVPSELLERRPDIAAAERRACAANSQIGAAQAAFFPTVSITGAVGVDSTAFSKLFNASSFAWGVSPQVYIPIFQAGRLVAQKRLALAKHKQALEDYRSVVLKAVREVEDSLVRVSQLQKRYEYRKTACQAAKKVEAYTQAQYELGAVDYFAASQAHRYSLMNELALMEIRGERYRATVSLICALGGSWKRGGISGAETLEPGEK